MDDGHLIELVRQFHHLYVKKDPNYKNKLMKEKSWQTISGILECSVDECEERWTVLRNKFNIENKASKNMPSGSGASTKKQWYLFSAMSFLDANITHRKTKGNILSTPSTSDELQLVTEDLDESQMVSPQTPTTSASYPSPNVEGTLGGLRNDASRGRKRTRTTTNEVIESEVMDSLQTFKKYYEAKASGAVENKGCAAFGESIGHQLSDIKDVTVRD